MESPEGPNPGIVLRVKCADKASFVMRNVQPTQPIRDFVQELSGLTSVPGNNMKILSGFPPKPVALNCALTVESLGFKSQETIIIQRGSPTDEVPNGEGNCVVLGCNKKCEQKPEQGLNNSKIAPDPAAVSQPQPKSVAPTVTKTEILKPKPVVKPTPAPSSTGNVRPVVPPPKTQANPSGSGLGRNGSIKPTNSNASRDEALNPRMVSNGVLLRHVVPADNSCLFTSFRFACGPILENHEKQLTPEDSIELREIVASCVMSDPEEYSDAVLGRKNADYVQWISCLDSWGGGIELAILAGFYEIEIAVVSAQTCTCNVFGESKNYVKRIYILYDGIHYDPLYMELADRSKIVTTFCPTDVGVYNQAIQIAKELFRNHQYTDLANFTIQCQVCKEKFTGQEDARQHAMKTGHTNFAEYSPPAGASGKK